VINLSSPQLGLTNKILDILAKMWRLSGRLASVIVLCIANACKVWLSVSCLPGGSERQVAEILVLREIRGHVSLRQLEGVELFRRGSEVAELVGGHTHGRKRERRKRCSDQSV
jgi:hypothetical protein